MRFEHDGTSFDYDPDDCDEFITATAWVAETVEALETARNARYAAEYLAQWLPQVASLKVLGELAELSPRWAFAEPPGEVEDPGPVIGP